MRRQVHSPRHFTRTQSNSHTNTHTHTCATHVQAISYRTCTATSADISLTHNRTHTRLCDARAGNKLQDVHSHIRSWPGNPASVMLMLTWGAIAQLLEPVVSLGVCVCVCVCVCESLKLCECEPVVSLGEWVYLILVCVSVCVCVGVCRCV